VDPTDSFIVVPDLGADLVRIFSINHETSELTPVEPFVVPAGSGPRHGAFLVQNDQTYFFLISELANTVVSYEVTYEPDFLNFTEIFSSGTLGDTAVPARVTSAEILVSVSFTVLWFISVKPFHINNLLSHDLYCLRHLLGF
jgi:6-phosphogluconolactonase (cycloisomerase 2 family)